MDRLGQRLGHGQIAQAKGHAQQGGIDEGDPYHAAQGHAGRGPATSRQKDAHRGGQHRAEGEVDRCAGQARFAKGEQVYRDAIVTGVHDEDANQECGSGRRWQAHEAGRALADEPHHSRHQQHDDSDLAELAAADIGRGHGVKDQRRGKEIESNA